MSNEEAASSSAASDTFAQRLRQFKYEHGPSAPPTTRSPGSTAMWKDVEPHSPTQSPRKRLRSLSSQTNSSATNSPKRKVSSGYADPSRYAHLSPLTDVLEPGLLLVFVGVNPGISTAQTGHPYAHPSNLFWKLLHSSGLTDVKHKPSEHRDLPRLYAYGNTNIVSRPTKNQSELSKEEMVQGTADLEEKFRIYRPKHICLVGKGIWEAVFKYKHGRAITKEEFHYGWQDEVENMARPESGEVDTDGATWAGARVFVATSTSGLAAALKPSEKEAIWKLLGDSIKDERRKIPVRAEETKALEVLAA